jgi:hypothetical protein
VAQVRVPAAGRHAEGREGVCVCVCVCVCVFVCVADGGFTHVPQSSAGGVGALVAFIDDAAAFYGGLASLFGDRPPSPEAAFVRHRLLLCLGDLHRYRFQALGEPVATSPGFDAAARCYREALGVYPGSGNAYNQLAVLATYRGSTFDAVYLFCRSLLAVAPFAARENYTSQLARAAASHASLAGTAEARRLSSQGHKALQRCSSALRASMLNWTCLQHLALAAGFLPGAAAAPPMALEAVVGATAATCRDTLRCLRAGVMDGGVALRVACVHMYAVAGEGSGGGGGGELPAGARARLALPLVVLFEHVTAIARHAGAAASDAMTSLRHAGRGGAPGATAGGGGGGSASVSASGDGGDEAGDAGDGGWSVAGASVEGDGAPKPPPQQLRAARYPLPHDVVDAVGGLLAPLGVFAEWLLVNFAHACGPPPPPPPQAHGRAAAAAAPAGRSASAGAGAPPPPPPHEQRSVPPLAAAATDASTVLASARERLWNALAALANKLAQFQLPRAGAAAPRLSGDGADAAGAAPACIVHAARGALPEEEEFMGFAVRAWRGACGRAWRGSCCRMPLSCVRATQLLFVHESSPRYTRGRGAAAAWRVQGAGAGWCGCGGYCARDGVRDPARESGVPACIRIATCACVRVRA